MLRRGPEPMDPFAPQEEVLHNWSGQAYVEGRAVYGELGLDYCSYRARIETIAGKYAYLHETAGGILPFLQQLHSSDLYLTTACAQRSEYAWNKFETAYRRYVVDLCRSKDRTSAGLGDAVSVWSDLFLPDRSGKSRIGSYDGRSSLTTWLRVLVSNRLINERRRRRNDATCLDDVPEVVDRMALKSVEERLWRSRYERILWICLEEVCKDLTARERLILVARYEEGLRLGEIASLLNIHLSSVTRQLDRLLKKLRAAVKARLASDFQLNADSIEECCRAIAEEDSLSIPVLSFLNGQDFCNEMA
jgi:RNA polymerase sigma-70 factor